MLLEMITLLLLLPPLYTMSLTRLSIYKANQLQLTLLPHTLSLSSSVKMSLDLSLAISQSETVPLQTLLQLTGIPTQLTSLPMLVETSPLM